MKIVLEIEGVSEEDLERRVMEACAERWRRKLEEHYSDEIAQLIDAAVEEVAGSNPALATNLLH